MSKSFIVNSPLIHIIISMEIINRKIELNAELLSQIPKNSVFFDIETTGFNYKYCRVYLIGCFRLVDNTPTVSLILSDSAHDETDILDSFLNIISPYTTLITFNGEGFDIPFLQNRGIKYDIDFNFSDYNRIDIYRSIKHYKELLGLLRVNQKSLEEFFGIHRQDKYDGGGLIPIYNNYINSRDKFLRELLILHNYEDVVGMLNILPAISYEKLKFIPCIINKTNIPEGIENESKNTANEIYISFEGNYPLSIPKPIRLTDKNYNIKINSNIISGYIILEKIKLNLYLKNIKDYVYLPLEEKIIPQALAGSIPKSRKERATRENCFVTEIDYFFKLPENKKFYKIFDLSNIKLYKSHYKEEFSYINITCHANANQNTGTLKESQDSCHTDKENKISKSPNSLGLLELINMLVKYRLS